MGPFKDFVINVTLFTWNRVVQKMSGRGGLTAIKRLMNEYKGKMMFIKRLF